MKRFLFLILALMCLGLSAMADVVISGSTAYGATFDVPSKAAADLLSQSLTVAGKGEALTASVAFSSSGSDVTIGEFYGTLNLAEVLKLENFTAQLRGGKLTSTDPIGNVGITAASKALELKAAVAGLTVKGAIAPANVNDWYAGADYSHTVGSVTVKGELYYDSSQVVAVDVGVNPTIGPLALTSRAGARMDLAGPLAWDAAVTATVKFFALGVTASGSDVLPFGAAAATVTLSHAVGIAVLRGYGKVLLYPAAVFAGCDAGILLNLGAADLVLGYAYKLANWAPVAPAGHGPYVNLSVSY